MEIILPDEVYQVISKFLKSDFKVYLVGGVVRDILMKRDASDWDLTTDATPEQILQLFPAGFLERSSQKALTIGKAFYNNQFGTVGIKLSAISNQSSASSEEAESRKLKTESSIIEVTTMRREGDYKDLRHPSKVSWTKNIEEDLKRRDFTINALALEINDRAKPIIIDSFDGQSDLKEKLIKAVGNPDTRFTEDALRLIRAIRFSAQLKFEIEEKTLESIKRNAQLIQNISWERIRDELFKILESDNAYEGVILLKETGILDLILPEVTECFGVLQEGPKHDRTYDIGEHLLLSLKFCPGEDPLVRLAVLIHDIGKKETFRKDALGNVTFYGHEIVGGRLARQVGERLKLSSKQTEKLYALVRWHMFTVSENQTDSAIRRFIKNVGQQNLDDMMAVRVGDRLGGGTATETSWRMEQFKLRIKEVLEKPFSISDMKITGTDVMEILQIKPGPKVGEILNKLFQEVLEDASKNDRKYLMSRIK